MLELSTRWEMPDPENVVKGSPRTPTLGGEHSSLLDLNLRFQKDGIENPSFLWRARGSLVNTKELTFHFK